MSGITLVRDCLPDLLPMRDRSPGTHVSDVIRSLCLQLGHYDDDRESNPTQLQLGQALEHAVITRHHEDDPQRYAVVGELQCDGLYLTPDLVDLHEQGPMEMKCTWMSSRHDIASEKFWKYWVQLRAYAYALRHAYGMTALVGQLTVVFVNGNYKGSGPQGFTWRAEFTDDGLARNWKMLTDHAASMASAST